MPSTLATADAVLKEDYKDEVRDQINQKTFITTQVEKNTEDVTGRRALLALHTRRSTGVGARKEYGTLPSAGNQGYQDIFIPVRYNYGRIELSGPVIQAMDKDRGSFVRAIKSETDGVKRDTARDVNRQIWGTADGVIAQCGTTTAATVVVLAATTTRTQMRQLWNEGGMLVDIGTVASPQTIATARAVTSFTNPPSPTITISGAAVTTTSSHYVFRSGNGGGPGTTGLSSDSQSELTGLQFMIAATGTLFTLSPTTEPSWASYVDSNSGTLRIASEGLINKAMMETELAGGSQVDLLVTSAGVSRALASSMQAMRRNVDNVQLKAGYSGIAWTSPTEGMGQAKAKALCWDRDCPENNLLGLATDHLVEFILNDWDWMDQDGAVLSRVSGKDAYEATLFKYHEMATDQRSAHFRVVDLIEG
jgi:hypothetical protein